MCRLSRADGVRQPGHDERLGVVPVRVAGHGHRTIQKSWRSSMTQAPMMTAWLAACVEDVVQPDQRRPLDDPVGQRRHPEVAEGVRPRSRRSGGNHHKSERHPVVSS
jgi:hypothetical protein